MSRPAWAQNIGDATSELDRGIRTSNGAGGNANESRDHDGSSPRLEADFRGLGRYYPARVTHTDPRTSLLTVQYADGAVETKVPAGRVRALRLRRVPRRGDPGCVPPPGYHTRHTMNLYLPKAIANHPGGPAAVALGESRRRMSELESLAAALHDYAEYVGVGGGDEHGYGLAKRELGMDWMEARVCGTRH